MAHGSSAYVCSKIAQMKLLEYVAAEEAADLFVVSVHPGVLMTDMVKDWSLGANLNESMLDDCTFFCLFPLPFFFFFGLLADCFLALLVGWVFDGWRAKAGFGD